MFFFKVGSNQADEALDWEVVIDRNKNYINEINLPSLLSLSQHALTTKKHVFVTCQLSQVYPEILT